jgi:type VI secretion system secreted protein Hcp
MERTLRPSPLSRTLALVPPAVALVAQQASGAFDVFIKMGTITGEVTSPKNYAGYIALDSFQWNATRAITTGGGGGSGRQLGIPSISEILISKKVDKASTGIFLNAVGPTTIPTVTLDVVNTSTSLVFYRLSLSEVLVSKQAHSGAPGADRPSEEISLNFTKIKIETFDADGKTVSGFATWDLTTNTKF